MWLCFLTITFQLRLANSLNLWHLPHNRSFRKPDTEYVANIYEAIVKMVKREAEIKEKLRLIKIREEKEAEIYRKYLANRVQSSVSRDFLTMRYAS